jgi:hypothetical protein
VAGVAGGGGVTGLARILAFSTRLGGMKFLLGTTAFPITTAPAWVQS